MPDTLVDAMGTRHRPAAAQARIVSLVPSITELLFDLDLGADVVGRTTFCIHPAARLADVPRVGGTKQPRIDKLRALEPSHVIVNIDENRREDVDAIAEFTPHVIVTHPLVPDDNLALYRLLGAIFDRDIAAEKLCNDFLGARDRLLDAASALPAQRVLYLIWREPWMTISRDTYISQMLALANMHTTCDDPAVRYPQVHPSAALLAGTDRVLFSSEPFPFKPDHADEFRALSGVEKVACDFIDGEMTSWYGSRAIAGLDYLRRFAGENPAR